MGWVYHLSHVSEFAQLAMLILRSPWGNLKGSLRPRVSIAALA